MSLKIRLKRMGKRNLPFYRLVVVDSRWRRDGKTIADIGWYDPVKQPGQCSIKVQEVYKWLENGAQLSETARSLLKQQGIWDKFRTGEYKNETEQSVVVNSAVEIELDESQAQTVTANVTGESSTQAEALTTASQTAEQPATEAPATPVENSSAATDSDTTEEKSEAKTE